MAWNLAVSIDIFTQLGSQQAADALIVSRIPSLLASLPPPRVFRAHSIFVTD